MDQADCNEGPVTLPISQIMWGNNGPATTPIRPVGSGAVSKWVSVYVIYEAPKPE